MSEKITSYQGMIGKTIKRIDDDTETVRVTFADDSYCDLEGGNEWIRISVSPGALLVNPSTYERPKIIKFESILDDLNILRSKTTGGSFGGFFGIK